MNFSICGLGVKSHKSVLLLSMAVPPASPLAGTGRVPNIHQGAHRAEQSHTADSGGYLEPSPSLPINTGGPGDMSD